MSIPPLPTTAIRLLVRKFLGTWGLQEQVWALEGEIRSLRTEVKQMAGLRGLIESMDDKVSALEKASRGNTPTVPSAGSGKNQGELP